MGAPSLSSILLKSPARLGAAEHAHLYRNSYQVRNLATTLVGLKSNLEGELDEAKRGDVFRQVDLAVATLQRLSRGKFSADEAQAVARAVGELLAEGVDPKKFVRAVTGTRNAAFSLFDDDAVVSDALRARLAKLDSVTVPLGALSPRATGIPVSVPIGMAGAVVTPKIRINIAKRSVAEVSGAEEGLASVIMAREVKQVIDALQPRTKLGDWIRGPKFPKHIEIKLSNGVFIRIQAQSRVGPNENPNRLFVSIGFKAVYEDPNRNAMLEGRFAELRHRAFASLEQAAKPALPPYSEIEKGMGSNDNWLRIEFPRGQESHYMEWLVLFLQAHGEIFTFEPTTTP